MTAPTNREAEELIAPGVVLFMDPVVLRRSGATCNAGGLGLFSDHYFVCARHGRTETATWLQLSSKGGAGRIWIDPALKCGHRAWRERPTYAVLTSRWTTSVEAALEASRAEFSWGSSGFHNRITRAGIGRLTSLLDQHDLGTAILSGCSA